MLANSDRSQIKTTKNGKDEKYPTAIASLANKLVNQTVGKRVITRPGSISEVHCSPKAVARVTASRYEPAIQAKNLH
jgi:hypothetical protein